MTRARLRWLVPISCWLAVAICALVWVATDASWLFLVGVIFLVLAAFFTLDAFGLTEEHMLTPRPPAEDRVRRLVTALSESTKVIAEIEREVKARGQLAERLQADVKRHQELLALNREEVEAVAQTFRLEVRREGSRSFWVGILVNAFFFAAGVAVTLVLGG